MGQLIRFHCKSNFLYVIIYWGLEIIYRLIRYQKKDWFQLTESDAENEYLYIIFLSISDFLSVSIVIYHCCRSKKVKYDSKINRREKYLKFIYQFILDLLARFAYYIFYKIFELNNDEVSPKIAHDIIIFVDVGMRFIFYNSLINGEIFLHKICSIYSVLFIYILLIVMDSINLIKSGEYNLNYCFYYTSILVFRSFLFPFSDTISKKLMIKENVLPYELMFARAIIQITLLLIITPILIATSNLNYTSDIFSSSNFCIIAPIYIIFGFVKAYLLLNVVYNYSSQSVSFLIISESLTGSINEIINFFNKKEKMSNSINIIFSIFEIFLVLLIGIITMIYEEIIIIKICGLQKNVKDEISFRADDDDSLARNINNLDVSLLPTNNS